MKVIDLYNKIANGEEIPKKIECDEVEYEYNAYYEDYYSENYDRYLHYNTALNDDIEILEDTPKEIIAKEMFEKLGYKLKYENMNYTKYIDDLRRVIKFDKCEYMIEKYIEDDYGNEQQLGWISKRELKAINKQVEELGWNK